MSEIKNYFGNCSSESINKRLSDTLQEYAEAFSREHVKNYLIKEKGAVKSKPFDPNVFFFF
jgi:hypothetical protein